MKVSTQVGNYLLNHKMKSLLELKEKSGVEVLFESQQYLPFENFAFNILERKKEEDRVIEQKSSSQRESRPDREARSEENGDKRGRGRRPSTSRDRGSRPSSAGRERNLEEDKILEQKANAFIGPRPEGEASPKESGTQRGRGRRPSTGRGRGRRPSTGRGRRTEEDKGIEQKVSTFIGPRPEGEASPKESGPQRGRGRRPSTGRGRGRRPSSALRERNVAEGNATEQKTSIFIGPRPEGQTSSAEKGEDGNRIRRPSTGRGRGRRPSGRPGTRNSTRSPRSRIQDSSRTDEGASTSTETKSRDANQPRENISSVKDLAPPSKAKPEREPNEDRQPMENVSRLHEVVIKNRPPYDSGPNRK